MANSPRYLEQKKYRGHEFLFQFRMGEKRSVMKMNSSAVSADTRVNTEDSFQNLQRRHFSELRLHADTSDEFSNQRHFRFLGSIAEDAIMTDSDESVRQNMQKEASDEFLRGKG